MGSAPWPHSPGIPLWQAATAEAIGTFALVIGVLAMTLNRHAPANWAGLVIGLNITALIILLGNVSGGAINPGRTIGPIFANWVLGADTEWAASGVYVVAELIGGLAAAVVYPAIALRPTRTSSSRG